MSRQRKTGAVEDLEYNNSPTLTKTANQETNKRHSFGPFGKLKMILVGVLGVYSTLLMLVYLSKTIRQQLVFVNYLNIPFVSYDPEKYGFSGARSFFIDGEDGKLGVWYIPAKESTAINDGKPVVLYLHGNAYSRAAKHRVATYKVLSALGCHVVAHDYRGFGDSAGTPSEEGLLDDSLAVYHWILANAGKSPIYTWGHSLGSAVTVAMSKFLTEKGDMSVKGVILEAPFNNMKEAAFNHPLATPYRILPFFQHTLKELNDMFKSDELIAGVNYDMLILHDHDDKIVKFESGKKLYEAAVKHKKKNQLIEFKEFTGFSHTTLHDSEDLPEILSEFMKLKTE